MTDIPIPMLLWCPECGARHIDADEFATRPHHTHACQECGHVWRPAVVNTVGVQFLPGFCNRTKYRLLGVDYGTFEDNYSVAMLGRVEGGKVFIKEVIRYEPGTPRAKVDEQAAKRLTELNKE